MIYGYFKVLAAILDAILEKPLSRAPIFLDFLYVIPDTQISQKPLKNILLQFLGFGYIFP